MNIIKRLKWKNIVITLFSLFILYNIVSYLFFTNESESTSNKTSTSKSKKKESNETVTSKESNDDISSEKSDTNNKSKIDATSNDKVQLTKEKIENEVKKHDIFSVVVKDLDKDSVLFEKDSDKKFKYTASDTKIILLYEFLKKAEKEKLDMSKKVLMKRDIISVDTFVVPGSMSTYEEIIHRLIKYSSNSDANYLIKYVFGGFDNVNKLVKSDFKNTEFRSYYSLGQWKGNDSNANDESTALQKIYNLNTKNSKKVFDYFKETLTDKNRSFQINNSIGGKIGNNPQTLSYNTIIKIGEKSYSYFIHLERKDDNSRLYMESPKNREIIKSIANNIFKNE